MVTTNEFVSFLASLESGRLIEDLDKQLRTVVAEMNRQVANAGGKPKAKLGLTLAFKYDGQVMEVEADVKAALPKPVRQRSICYRTKADTLSPENQRQLSMPFDDVSAERGVRDVAAAAPAPLRAMP